MAISYWAYLHSNGTVQVKRWFGDHQVYTTDCLGNPFVQKVKNPFLADSYEEACEIAKEYLVGNNVTA